MGMRARRLVFGSTVQLAIGLLLASLGPGRAEAAMAEQVVAGGNHTCALTSEGAVLCWGDNGLGQLGDGSSTSSPAPIGVSGLPSDVVGIAARGSHSCAVSDAGGVLCWGYNGAGQLGDGTVTNRSSPVPVVGLASGISAVAAGSHHSCALTDTGGVLCWGGNASGQLGDGTNTPSLVPVAVSGLSSGVVAIAAGDSSTCAVTVGGGAQCWGSRPGDGGAASNLPVAVSGLSGGVAAVAAGNYHSCALLDSGEVRCWGSNDVGQLGDHPAASSSVPVVVNGITLDPGSLAAGGSHTCVGAASTGGVQCWGANDAGMLGNGTTVNSNVPVSVSNLSGGIASLSASELHTCAATLDGLLWCWGSNLNGGALGNGLASRHLQPSPVSGMANGVAAVATGDRHTCAAHEGGAWCWGDNMFGKLGSGDPEWVTSLSGTPLPVVGLASGVAAVAAGSDHSCALADGGVKCWGNNGFGQLGDGGATPFETALPVPVSGLASGVTDLAADRFHTCAVLAGGEARCWGDNEAAQLGDGTTTNRNAPVAVVGLSGDAISIEAGDLHNCALIAGGDVDCWGTGYLGGGGSSLESPPVTVAGLSNVDAIAVGGRHTCALSMGSVSCWGLNSSGQLGDGTTADRDLPVAVSGLSSGVVAIAAGDVHTCAALSNGLELCWGDNPTGQLGDGTTVDRSTPVPVGSLPGDVQALAGGEWHTCALLATGGLQCWGDNGWGQLGNGWQGIRTTPVAVVGFQAPEIPAAGPIALVLLVGAIAAAAGSRLRG